MPRMCTPYAGTPRALVAFLKFVSPLCRHAHSNHLRVEIHVPRSHQTSFREHTYQSKIGFTVTPTSMSWIAVSNSSAYGRSISGPFNPSFVHVQLTL